MNPRYQYRFSFGGGLTPVVKAIIIINVCVFVLLNLARGSGEILMYLGLVPAMVAEKRYVWQLLTYMFIHTAFIHVLFNMLALWWFGCDIERNFGRKYFLRYYFITGIGGGLLALIYSWGSPVPTIGASGAVMGILLAYAILYPNRQILFMFILPVKAKWIVLIFAAMEFLALAGGNVDGISHSAHIGGLVAGLLWFAYYLKLLNFKNIKRMFKGSRRKGNKPDLHVVRDKDNLDDFFNDDRNGTVH